MASISELLEETLDLIGKEETSGIIDKNPPLSVTSAFPSVSIKSASAALLEERKKLKRKIDDADFIPFNSGKTTPAPIPILEQISNSTVDAPKYWNNNNNNKKSKKEVVHIMTNDKKKKKLKGEGYSDRFAEKQHSKNMRKSLLNTLKKSF